MDKDDSEALASIDNAVEDSDEQEDVIDGDELAEDDVLLSEAGNILVDALMLQERAYALTAQEQDD